MNKGFYDNTELQICMVQPESTVIAKMKQKNINL